MVHLGVGLGANCLMVGLRLRGRVLFQRLESGARRIRGIQGPDVCRVVFFLCVAHTLGCIGDRALRPFTQDRLPVSAARNASRGAVRQGVETRGRVWLVFQVRAGVPHGAAKS